MNITLGIPWMYMNMNKIINKFNFYWYAFPSTWQNYDWKKTLRIVYMIKKKTITLCVFQFAYTSGGRSERRVQSNLPRQNRLQRLSWQTFLISYPFQNLISDDKNLKLRYTRSIMKNSFFNKSPFFNFPFWNISSCI